MDFTSEGLSWENVYHKIEKMYKSSDLVQIPCKYVDVIGKQFMDMIDGVVGDLLEPAGHCVEGSDSEKSVDGDIISKATKNLKEELDKKFSDSVPPCVEVESDPSYVETSVKMESDPLSVENLSLIASSDSTQDLSYKSEFDGSKEETLPSKAINCLDVIDGNSENSLSSVASVAGLQNMCPLADETLELESCESKSVEDRSPTETCDAVGGIHTSQVLSSPSGYFVKEHELQTKHDKSESFRQEMKDCFDGDDNFNSVDALDLNTQLIEEFQDLDIHDGWEDNEDYELAMISYQKSRKPYKKSLPAALITRLRRLKGRKVVYSNCNLVINNQGRQGNGLLMDSKMSSVHDSLESDWELV